MLARAYTGPDGTLQGPPNARQRPTGFDSVAHRASAQPKGGDNPPFMPCEDIDHHALSTRRSTKGIFEETEVVTMVVITVILTL